MNKNVSLAIEKAVGSINKIHPNNANQGPKKPDLFSLTGATELFQNEKGITIHNPLSKKKNLIFQSFSFNIYKNQKRT